jgi:hypothetical protein
VTSTAAASPPLTRDESGALLDLPFAFGLMLGLIGRND